MKVRNKKSGDIGYSNKYDVHALGEVIVGYEDKSTQEFTKDLDVYLEVNDEWVDMHEAFVKDLIITDNYNEYFREPKNQEEKDRGYYL